jgi:D-alanine-D-alanine ligase
MTTPNFGKVGVLLGGTSAEREVSLKSGAAVCSALSDAGVDAYAFDTGEHSLADLMSRGFERLFIALHGRGGEDGTIQGVLETLRLPYTGSGVLASALAMDKWRTKLVWSALGLPTPAYQVLRHDTDFSRVVADLGLPIFVKPAREGSSIGMTKVKHADELRAAFESAVRFDALVLAEAFVEGAEYTVGIVGDQALPVIKLETAQEFYDYQAKYVRNDTRYLCPCGLPPDRDAALRALALDAYRALGCRGWGRVDVMTDRAGNPWLLEANTAPGMTDHSLVPMAARAAGMSFPQLAVRILELAGCGA